MPDPIEPLRKTEPFVPTPAEARAANGIAVASTIMFVVALVIGNVTGAWLWMVLYFVVLAVTLGSFTALAARRRRMSFWQFAKAIVRAPGRA
jgi:hypothetical protein